MDISLFLIIGAVAGILSSHVVHNDIPPVLTILVGMASALVGAYLYRTIDIDAQAVMEQVLIGSIGLTLFVGLFLLEKSHSHPHVSARYLASLQ